MKRSFVMILVTAILAAWSGSASAAAFFQSHFSGGEGYTVGNISGQQGWYVIGDPTGSGEVTEYEELAINGGYNFGQETHICHDYPQPAPGETVISEMWVSYDMDFQDYAVVWGDPFAQLGGGGEPTAPTPANPTAAMVLFYWDWYMDIPGAWLIVNEMNSGYFLASGNWELLEVVNDYQNMTTDVYMNSMLIADDYPFIDPLGQDFGTIYFAAFGGGGNTLYISGLTVSPVPEPSTAGLIALGIAGIAVLKRRNRKA
ncbi:MAG TPA: PEP-CTERM sorting domain-containing protein [Candidatus Brocadiia bacterium]|nr:PEP-CTERM sorting domain-containing protein [Candidatus Brocadiia bacterium]